MHVLAAEQSLQLLRQERQHPLQAHRAARLLAARRWERRAAAAERRARLARSAVL